MQLEDRFYTSTEVAEILGVSLRSVYRYLEDGKLKAEVKTATGRHRFTRQNINDFLYPDGKSTALFVEDDSKKQITRNQQEIREPTQTHVQENIQMRQDQGNMIKKQMNEDPQPIEEREEQVDWLAKFREAASKYKQDETENEIKHEVQQPFAQSPSMPVAEPARPYYEQKPMSHPSTQYNQENQYSAPQQPRQEPMQPIQQPVYQPPVYSSPAYSPQTSPEVSFMYYRSMLGGLKDIAQNLDKSARNSNLDYAFTLNAGASLHKPIKPFATLHAYVKSSDRDFFEKILRLTASNQSNAQLCLMISDSSAIYANREEVHGLFVVARDRLKKDISVYGDAHLAQEVADIL